MKILTLDIETSPNVAHVWSLWNQNVGLSQLRESTEMMSFAAKWYDQSRVLFYSQYHDTHKYMVERAYELVNEADVVVHFNGRKFDMPHLNREFLMAGYTPPAPYQQVDLLEVVRKRFRFPSNKLQYVASTLGLGSKTSHEGHELWVKCLAGDARAWAKMRKYNKQDVVLTEQLYDKLLPWIGGHPNTGLYDALTDVCPNCGSAALVKEGWSYTAISKFQRYHCVDCGTWSRSGKAEDRVDPRSMG